MYFAYASIWGCGSFYHYGEANESMTWKTDLGKTRGFLKYFCWHLFPVGKFLMMHVDSSASQTDDSDPRRTIAAAINFFLMQAWLIFSQVCLGIFKIKLCWGLGRVHLCGQPAWVGRLQPRAYFNRIGSGSDSPRGKQPRPFLYSFCLFFSPFSVFSCL